MAEHPELNCYRERGYLIVRGLFPPSSTREVLDEAHQLFVIQMQRLGIALAPEPSDVEIEQAMGELFRRDRAAFIGAARLCQQLPSLHRRALEERVLLVLKELGQEFPTICTRPVISFHSAQLAESEIYYKMPPHQDWRTMQGSLDAVVVWVPLVDVDSPLGALEILPRSHHRGLFEARPVDWNFHAIPAEALAGEFLPVELAAGDALFFSAFLAHRSGSNVTSRVRWSMHFRYNNALEPSFVGRKFPNPYLYKPQADLMFADFPRPDDLARVWGEPWPK